MRWFEAQLPGDGTVRGGAARDASDGLGARGAAVARGAGGADRPRRRRTPPCASWTTARWTWPGCRRSSTASATPASSATRSGSSPATCARLYLAVKEAGAAHGIVDFGMRALLVDAAGEELADLVRRAASDLRRLRGRHGALRAARQAGLRRARGGGGGAGAGAAAAPGRARDRRGGRRRDGRRADLGAGGAGFRRGRGRGTATARRASTPTGPATPKARRPPRRRLAGRRLGDLGRLRALRRAARWRRATCRRRWRSGRRRASSRSRSSAAGGRRASRSSRRSTPRGCACAADPGQAGMVVQTP